MSVGFFDKAATIHPVTKKERLVIQPTVMHENKGVVAYSFDVYPGILIDFIIRTLIINHAGHYMLNSFTLKTKFSIRQSNGDALTAEHVVAPVSCIHHTMVMHDTCADIGSIRSRYLYLQWSDVSLKLNDCLVETSNNNYPYKAYLLSNFARSKAAKDGELAYKEILYPDDGGSIFIQIN